MSDLPDPLTPEDCDLRGLPFMQLDVVRLIDSDLFALSTGDEFKASVALWCKSWTQLPAASLPDDDRVLAHLSGSGTKWKRIKAMALRGWVKCSDGRLYHPTVAEKALHAWKARTNQRERAAKRWNKNNSSDGNATASENDMPRHSHGISQGNAIEREREREISSLRSDEREGAPLSLAPAVDADDGQTDLEDFTGPASPKPKRAARLPADWQPSAEDAEFARSLGLDADRVSAVFRDYWSAKGGKDATKTDWSATWRNWCRREQQSVMTGGKVAVSGPRQGAPQSAREIQRQNAESLADRMARRYGKGVQA
ncbi:DUF1376 domain-containing protein [Acetobacter sp. UBA5411]|uniref:DUF1376 domain-containing protein n=1 Tax=Acetobacter sp. UBA5411 TaxID=1945905 RepID=UPI0025B847C1|nr:DUF1376 domain-containing protein [Acetobacter sp. UBA5411]